MQRRVHGVHVAQTHEGHRVQVVTRIGVTDSVLVGCCAIGPSGAGTGARCCGHDCVVVVSGGGTGPRRGGVGLVVVVCTCPGAGGGGGGVGPGRGGGMGAGDARTGGAVAVLPLLLLGLLASGAGGLG